MKRFPALFAGSFVLAGAFRRSWGIYRDGQLRRGLDRIGAGDPESEVLQALGRPKRVER